MDGSKVTPPAGGRAGTIALVVLTVIGIVIIAALMLLPFSPPAEDESGVGGISEHLLGGNASDHVLGVQDMGQGWERTDVLDDTDVVMGSPLPTGLTSAATTRFYQNSSGGELDLIVDVTVAIFSSVDDASSYYSLRSATDASLDTSPVLLCNVTLGDGGVILDGPHITLGHEAKWLVFRDRNAVCQIAYHHAWTYETLPNALLEDVARDLESKL